MRVTGLQTDRNPRWVLKISPLTLIDPESSVNLGVERLLGGRHTLQTVFGYGNEQTGPQSWGSSERRQEVWRGNLEWRVYTRRDREANRWRNRRVFNVPLGNYLAVETFYKQVNTLRNGTMARGCEDGNCEFFQDYTGIQARYVAGVHLKAGQQNSIRLSPENNRLLVDYYLGFGLRKRWLRDYRVPMPEDGRPAVGRFSGGSLFGDEPGVFASLSLGFRVGYAF